LDLDENDEQGEALWPQPSEGEYNGAQEITREPSLFVPSATSFVKCGVAPSWNFTVGVVLCTMAAATLEYRTLESALHAAATGTLMTETASAHLCAPEDFAVVIAVFMPCASAAVVHP